MHLGFIKNPSPTLRKWLLARRSAKCFLTATLLLLVQNKYHELFSTYHWLRTAVFWRRRGYSYIANRSKEPFCWWRWWTWSCQKCCKGLQFFWCCFKVKYVLLKDKQIPELDPEKSFPLRTWILGYLCPRVSLMTSKRELKRFVNSMLYKNQILTKTSYRHIYAYTAVFFFACICDNIFK